MSYHYDASKYPSTSYYPVQSQNNYQPPAGRPRFATLATQKLIKAKLLLVLLVELTAAILCGVYASSAYGHWRVIAAHPDQFKYPDLDVGDLKKGFIAAIGRIAWAFVLAISGFFAPVWLNLVVLLIGLAWEVPLGNIATTNFGYLITVGTGQIYPATSSQCAAGNLSDPQKSFFATVGSFVSKDAVSVCADFANEGMVLQAYCIVGLVAAFVFFILVAIIGSCSTRERKTMTESAFSLLSNSW